jgi:hypothetical protein
MSQSVVLNFRGCSHYFFFFLSPLQLAQPQVIAFEVVQIFLGTSVRMMCVCFFGGGCEFIKFFSSILHRAENHKTLGLANFK